MDWNTKSVPIINEKMPTIKDYVLTVWTITSTLGLVLITDHPALFSDSQISLISNFGLTVLISFPWWFWRSFRASWYYKQHKSIKVPQTLALLATNCFTYGLIGFVLWEVPSYIRGEKLSGLFVVMSAIILWSISQYWRSSK